MNESIKYLIALPVRNGGSYLKLCVKSVLAQIGARFRLIVLDNASDDGSTRWIRSLDDPRVTLLESAKTLTIEENWARIRLIDSEDEYLTIIGHDDLLESDFLANMTVLIGSNPGAKLYHSRFKLIDKDGNRIRDARISPGVEECHEFLAARMKFQRDSYGTGYVLRMKDYVAVGGIPQFKKLMFADDALWMQVMTGSFKVTGEKASFSYRVHSGSTSFSPNWRATFEALRSYLELLVLQSQQDLKIRDVMLQSIEGFMLFWLRWAYFSTPTESRDRMSLGSAFGELYDVVAPLVGRPKKEEYERRATGHAFGKLGYMTWIAWRAMRRVRAEQFGRRGD